MERPHQRKLPPAPTRIVVADDEHLVAAGIAANLGGLGLEVIGPAASGKEAVELCRSQQPDMALLDIRMPDGDGIEAAETIFREMGIPAMILSAYSDDEYVQGASRSGIFGYLLKPVTKDQLRAAITVAWARFQEHVSSAEQITDLQVRLENRKTIEQAKWIIVSRKGVDEPEAMRLLQRQARNNRRPLVEVAAAVLENENLF